MLKTASCSPFSWNNLLYNLKYRNTLLTERTSGILLHITSLPSPYGIGDLGKAAYRFADVLHTSNTRYWQVLPINSTLRKFGHSPYSGLSAFAGNPLLISPELLYNAGLLAKSDLGEVIPHSEEVDFDRAQTLKAPLFEKAWLLFKKQRGQEHSSYLSFCNEHKFWLDDYALFVALFEKYKGETWNRWPRALRDREPSALKEVRKTMIEPIEKEKFLQYQFYRQWSMLRAYCKEKEVLFFGDLPFYVNLNSADVWSFPGYFKLSSSKKPLFVSGVPPDYFSKSGQLWGTPVYDWAALQADQFNWWKHRIAHNFKFFDLLRLDHFRAFSECWEVPAKEETAINGKWMKVPGEAFFKSLEKLGINDKIVAEDLGDIDQAVLDLAQKFQFPGMRVLQFAFETKPAGNQHVPFAHEKNSVCYTATHDNNTSRGWFESEAPKEQRINLQYFLGKPVRKETVARDMIRMCWNSPANLSVIPVQDLLGLGPEGLMNRPGTSEGNWRWRLLPGQLKKTHVDFLREINDFFWRNKGPIKVC